jgi:hypothetical protein
MKRNVQSPLYKLRCAGSRGALDFDAGVVAVTPASPVPGSAFGSIAAQGVEFHMAHKTTHSAPEDRVQNFILTTFF